MIQGYFVLYFYTMNGRIQWIYPSECGKLIKYADDIAMDGWFVQFQRP